MVFGGVTKRRFQAPGGPQGVIIWLIERASISRHTTSKSRGKPEQIENLLVLGVIGRDVQKVCRGTHHVSAG